MGVGADVPIRPRQLPNFYGCWHQARIPGPAGQFSADCLASGSGAEAGAIHCTTRAGCEEILPGSVSRSGGPGAGDWSACTPRSQPPGIFGSFHPWKEHEKEDSAAPAAGSFAHGGKGTKTPFFSAPAARTSFRRAKFEWPPPLLPGHWALARQMFGLTAPTGSAWLVPCCLAYY